METEDGEKTKEAKMAKLEELQREQAEREESSRVFGTEKPGIFPTYSFLYRSSLTGSLSCRRGQMGKLRSFVGYEYQGDDRHR
jgi:hypothetical protein